MELMACARWVGGTTYQIFIFPDLKCKYQWYEILLNCLHHSQSCHSHFGCRLLPIWPKLVVWAENGAYGLCRLGWWYNEAKLSFSWPNMLLSMIWNTSELSALHLSRAIVVLVVDCCQFDPNCMFGLKWSLCLAPTWLAVQQSKAVFFLTNRSA